jgi:hypothetical protein
MSEARSVARAPSSSVGHGGGEGAEVVWDDPSEFHCDFSVLCRKRFLMRV